MGEVEGRVLSSVDGVTSPAEIAHRLTVDGVRISVATVEAFLRTCSRRGLLERTATESSILQLERLRAERSRRRSFFRGELLRMRWSFGDPNALLDRTLPFLRWLFTRSFVVSSIALWLAAAWVAVGQSARFHSEISSLLQPANLTVARVVLVWITILVVSLVHELGHAYTCKYYGGEVHELGFMLMYFEPAFYCNVNDAWSFPELRARLWVTAAGGWIELVLAALAMMVWAGAQPGTTVSEFALVLTLFAGGLGLISNANPLLPLDGYFALSDALGIPNLRQRGLGHWGWWIRRHVLRLDVPEPPASADERRLLLRYGSLASLNIVVALAFTFYFVGRWVWRGMGGVGLIALGVVAVLVVRSMLSGWGRTLRDASTRHGARIASRLRGPRARASALGIVLLFVLALVLPWPITSTGSVRAVSATPATNIVPTDSGIVSAVLVREGQRVVAGEPVLLLTDPILMRERESRTRAVAARSADALAARVRGDAAAEAIATARKGAAQMLATDADYRISQHVVRARTDGIVATQHPEMLMGRMLAPGATALQLADADSIELHIDLGGTGAVLVRPGMTVHLLSYINTAHPIVASIGTVAALGDTADATGRVEARVRMARDAVWRPGATGEASVVLRRSTLLAAMWRWMRAEVRTDLWL
jgi:multidrug resistance efflux pump